MSFIRYSCCCVQVMPYHSHLWRVAWNTGSRPLNTLPSQPAGRWHFPLKIYASRLGSRPSSLPKHWQHSSASSHPITQTVTWLSHISAGLLPLSAAAPFYSAFKTLMMLFLTFKLQNAVKTWDGGKKETAGSMSHLYANKTTIRISFLISLFSQMEILPKE